MDSPNTLEARARELLASTYEGPDLAHIRQTVLNAPADEFGQWFHHAIEAIEKALRTRSVDVETLIPRISREVDRRTSDLMGAIVPIYEAYHLNDCAERIEDDALEISLSDLRALVEAVDKLDSGNIAKAALTTPLDPVPDIQQMREALTKAAERFRECEASHRAKAEAERSYFDATGADTRKMAHGEFRDRNRKADRNREMAELCEAALDPVKGADDNG